MSGRLASSVDRLAPGVVGNDQLDRRDDHEARRGADYVYFA